MFTTDAIAQQRTGDELKRLAPEVLAAFHQSLNKPIETDSDASFDASTLLSSSSKTNVTERSSQKYPVKNDSKRKQGSEETSASRLPACSTYFTRASGQPSSSDSTPPIVRLPNNQGSTQASTSKSSATSVITHYSAIVVSDDGAPVERVQTARKSVVRQKPTDSRIKPNIANPTKASDDDSRLMPVKKNSNLDAKVAARAKLVIVSPVDSSDDELKLSAQVNVSIKKAPVVIEISDSEDEMTMKVVVAVDTEVDELEDDQVLEVSSSPPPPKKSSLRRGRPAPIPPVTLPKKTFLFRGRPSAARIEEMIETESDGEGGCEDVEEEEEEEDPTSSIAVIHGRRLQEHRKPRELLRKSKRQRKKFNISTSSAESSESDNNDDGDHQESTGSEESIARLTKRTGLRTRDARTKRHRNSTFSESSNGSVELKERRFEKKTVVQYVQEEQDSDTKARVHSRGKALENPQNQHTLVSLTSPSDV